MPHVLPSQPAPAAPATPPAPPALAVSVPNHDGSPQDGRHAQIGDPTRVIGALASATSTWTLEQAANPPPPPRPATPGLALPILLGFGGIALGVVAGVVLRQVFKHSLDSLDLRSGQERLLFILLSVLPLSAGGAGLGVVLSRRAAARKNSARPQVLGECTFVGAEGLARGQRTAVGEELETVRFEDVSSLKVSRKVTELTTVRGSRKSVSLHDDVSLAFFGPGGRQRFAIWASLMRGASFDQSQAEARLAFAAAAEDAYCQFQLPRLLATLEQQGTLRFGVGRADALVVRADRIEVTRAGATTSFAPGEVKRLELAAGKLVLEAGSAPPVQFALADVENARLLMACLKAVGASPAARG